MSLADGTSTISLADESSTMSFSDAFLQTLRNVCDSKQIEYRLVGGVAINLHSGERATKVDIPPSSTAST